MNTPTGTERHGALRPCVRAFLAVGAAAVLGGCANMGGGLRSEVPLEEEQVAALPSGLARNELLQRLGPPSDEGAYPRLNETVVSWRMIEPGNRRVFFNAHMDGSGRVKHYSRTIDPTGVGGDDVSP